MLTNSALTRVHITNKVRWVCDHFLAQAISEFNTATGQASEAQVLFPKTIDIGVDSIRLSQSSSPVDGLPAINILEAGSTVNLLDVNNIQDELIDFDIVAMTGSEIGDIAWNTRMSQQLALLVSQVLEQYLPESPGEDSSTITSIYRCDTTSVYNSRSIPIKGTSFFLAATTVRIKVYARSSYGSTTSLLPSTYKPKPSFFSNYQPLAATAVLNTSTDINFTMQPQAFTNVTATNTQMTSAVDLTITFDSSIPDGTIVTLTNQNTRAQASATVASSAITVLTTGDFVVTANSIWTFDIVLGPADVTCSYTLCWRSP